MAVHAGYFESPPPFKTLKDRKDMRPMKMVDVFAMDAKGEIVLKSMKWGLIPSYFTGHVRDWTASTFHARLETVAHTQSYARAWRLKRRVLFPMNHFSEKARPGVQIGGSSGPARVTIRRADDKPLAVGGIYDFAQTVDGAVLSAAMLTRAPGPRMLLIHDREPVVVEPEYWQAWLSGADDLDLMTPWADDGFRLGVDA